MHRSDTWLRAHNEPLRAADPATSEDGVGDGLRDEATAIESARRPVGVPPRPQDVAGAVEARLRGPKSRGRSDYVPGEGSIPCGQKIPARPTVPGSATMTWPLPWLW